MEQLSSSVCNNKKTLSFYDVPSYVPLVPGVGRSQVVVFIRFLKTIASDSWRCTLQNSVLRDKTKRTSNTVVSPSGPSI